MDKKLERTESNDTSGEGRGWDLYYLLQPWARLLKTALQMAIGVALVAWIVTAVAIELHDFDIGALPMEEFAKRIFSGTGLALAISAAIELGYTLFTEGPDEAIEPLLLGTSATLTILLGRLNPGSLEGLWEVAVVGALLCALFGVRKYLANAVLERWPFQELRSAQVPLRKSEAHVERGSD